MFNGKTIKSSFWPMVYQGLKILLFLCKFKMYILYMHFFRFKDPKADCTNEKAFSPERCIFWVDSNFSCRPIPQQKGLWRFWLPGDWVFKEKLSFQSENLHNIRRVLLSGIADSENWRDLCRATTTDSLPSMCPVSGLYLSILSSSCDHQHWTSHNSAGDFIFLCMINM